MARSTIRRSQFKRSGQWQTFSLDFTNIDGQSLEFQTYWHGNANVKLDHITLTIDPYI